MWWFVGRKESNFSNHNVKFSGIFIDQPFQERPFINTRLTFVVGTTFFPGADTSHGVDGVGVGLPPEGVLVAGFGHVLTPKDLKRWKEGDRVRPPLYGIPPPPHVERELRFSKK